MLAFVLSGAANYGAMQVGALEVLLDANVRPQMVVGTSAGSLNAVHLSADPTSQGVQRLVRAWGAVAHVLVSAPNLLFSLRRLIAQKDSLLSSDPLARFLRRQLPGIETFGQLTALHNVPAYAVAVCMETGQLTAFGDRSEDRVLDGMMASTAIPPYFPPWVVNGGRYLDGGVYAKLPVRVAVERGATQVIAVNVRYAIGTLERARGVFGISGYALSLMSEHQSAMEVAWARSLGVPVYHIPLQVPVEVDFWDYSQSDVLVRLGREGALRTLEAQPFRPLPAWRLRLLRALARFRDCRPPGGLLDQGDPGSKTARRSAQPEVEEDG